MDETLIDYVLKEGMVSLPQVQKAREIAAAEKIPVIQQLIASGAVNEALLLQHMSKKFSIPATSVQRFSMTAIGIMPLEQIQMLRCIPFKLETDGTLHVGLVDPSDLAHIEALQSNLGRPVTPHFIAFSAFQAAMHTLLKDHKTSVANRPMPEALRHHEAPAQKPPLLGPTVVHPGMPAPAVAPVLSPLIDSSPREKPKQNLTPAKIKKYGTTEQVSAVLKDVLTEAVSRGASDVHVEPYPTQVRIRCRLGGALFDIASVAPELREQLATRIKVVSNLDIAERRLPQDGRSKLKVGNEEVNFRVSIIPSLHGETAVFRVLRQTALNLPIEKIGFDAKQLASFRKGVDAPNGMVLITGPTGSGKTTTMYAALSNLNETTLKIATAEDPIEYNLPGITQVSVNKETGLDFAEVLKSLLRQDPDILLVGEIRDKETAAVAVQAALTGHLVFSSLHTNDAPSAVVRLLNMGVEPFAVLAAVNVVVAQRLVRRICENCAERAEATDLQLRSLGEDRRIVEAARLVRGKGCEECFGGGYRGRVAIFEVLELTDTMKEKYLKGDNLISMKRAAAAEGMKTLRQSALALAAAGLTTIEEAIANTQER